MIWAQLCRMTVEASASRVVSNCRGTGRRSVRSANGRMASTMFSFDGCGRSGAFEPVADTSSDVERGGVIFFVQQSSVGELYLNHYLSLKSTGLANGPYERPLPQCTDLKAHNTHAARRVITAIRGGLKNSLWQMAWSDPGLGQSPAYSGRNRSLRCRISGSSLNGFPVTTSTRRLAEKRCPCVWILSRSHLSRASKRPAEN